MCAFAVGGKSARGGSSAVAAAADDGKIIRRIRGTAQLKKKGKQEKNKKRNATFKCDLRNEMPLIGDYYHFLARNVEHDGFPCKIEVAVKKYKFQKNANIAESARTMRTCDAS